MPSIKGTMDRIKAYLDRLERREWTVVALTGGGILGLIIIVSIVTLLAQVSKMEKKVRQTEKILKEVTVNSNLYQDYRKQTRELEGRLSQPGESMATFLEKSASNLGIVIESIKPKNIQTTDYFKEHIVEVKINKVVLRDLVEFFYTLETHPKLLHVSQLSIKPSYANPAHLNVTFSVSSYEVLRGN